MRGSSSLGHGGGRFLCATLCTSGSTHVYAPEPAKSCSRPHARWRWREPEESWWRNPKWIWNFIRSWKGKPAVQAHEVGALLLQLSVVILLMRLLRPGVPFPGGSSTSKSESSSSAYVSVPFSEFLSSVGQNDVENVEIDGFHLSYSLRPSARQARLQKAIQVILPSLFVAW